MAKIKKTVINVEEDVAKSEPSQIAGRNINWFRNYEKQFGSS